MPGSSPIGVPGSVLHSVSASYSGPIPPPAFLREYDEIVPGSAERLLAMAEHQTNHRIRLESKAMNNGITRSWGGLIAGFVIAMTALGGGIFLAHEGHDWAGATIGTVGLASLVGVFVIGSRSVSRERENKSAMMRRR